jgi:hypothetical protein
MRMAMWIASIFGLTFLGFLATTGVGATSVTLLAVPRWRALGRRGLFATTLAACILWAVVARRVDFAGSHALSAVGSFAAAVGLPGLIGASLFVAQGRPSRKWLVLALASVLVLWLFSSVLLGFALACQLDVTCDL